MSGTRGGSIAYGSARAAQMHETTLASSHSVQIERTFKWRVARTFHSDALLKARCSRLWSAHNQHSMSLPCSPGSVCVAGRLWRDLLHGCSLRL